MKVSLVTRGPPLQEWADSQGRSAPIFRSTTRRSASESTRSSRPAASNNERRWRLQIAAKTILVGRLPDQAALAGILKTLYKLHLPVVKTECVDSEEV